MPKLPSHRSRKKLDVRGQSPEHIMALSRDSHVICVAPHILLINLALPSDIPHEAFVKSRQEEVGSYGTLLAR
jgi:hypothetical protein